MSDVSMVSLSTATIRDLSYNKPEILLANKDLSN